MRQSSRNRRWQRTSFGVGLLLLAAAPIFAATVTVTSTADNGPGSLRTAIASAATGDTIDFSLAYPATITLSTPLTLNSSVTITGPGASNLSISAGFSVGVLVVQAETNVQISGVTITQGGSGLGGCIFNAGTLTLTNTTVTNCRNFAELGGAILNAGTGAILNLASSTVTGNFAGAECLQSSFGAGGGIFNYLGTVNLTNSTVSENLTFGGPGAGGNCFAGGQQQTGWGGGGGGILNFDGTLAVSTSTVVGNSSSFGGGILNISGATLTVVNSTIALNTAGAAGGGIDTSSDSTALISDSTIWNNGAGNASGLSIVALNLPTGGGGGGSCCIFLAISDSGGGGILYGGNALSVKNSILSANSTNCETPYGEPFNSLGFNISDDATCGGALIQTSDLNNTPAGLDPAGLRNNGGPTQTVALQATSPAVNAIPPSACTDASGTPVTTDQRGVPRPQGGGCDIGAFEYFHSLYQIPAVQTFGLIEAVKASTLPPAVTEVLTVPLQAAVNSLNRGNIPASVAQLEVFVILVDVAKLARELSQQQAAVWTTSAAAIIQSLRSGAP